MNLHKIGIKLFTVEDEPLDLLRLIPVFHQWIQRSSLDDLLIDVADYTHVPDGPGVMLIAHEGNYGYDETAGEPGLLYYSKHPIDRPAGERFAAVCRKTLEACRLLERAESTDGKLHFPGQRIQIFSNDRLEAPNTDEAYAEFEPLARGLLDKLFPRGYELTRVADPRERLSVTAIAKEPADSATLLERLAA